jgi:hypothetical protein
MELDQSNLYPKIEAWCFFIAIFFCEVGFSPILHVNYIAREMSTKRNCHVFLRILQKNKQQSDCKQGEAAMFASLPTNIQKDTLRHKCLCLITALAGIRPQQSILHMLQHMLLLQPLKPLTRIAKTIFRITSNTVDIEPSDYALIQPSQLSKLYVTICIVGSGTIHILDTLFCLL